MIYTDMNIGDTLLYNYKTGEEILRINAQEFSKELNTKENPNTFVYGSSGFASIELEDTYINQDALNSLLGIGINSSKYSMQFDRVLYQKQIRTHKKYRINKKWAKRYGFRDVIGTYETDMNGGKYYPDDNTLEFDFTNYRLIKIDGRSIKMN